jgi:hypothetical protein
MKFDFSNRHGACPAFNAGFAWAFDRRAGMAGSSRCEIGLIQAPEFPRQQALSPPGAKILMQRLQKTPMEEA